MARSKLLSSAIGTAFMAAACASTPALAIDPGCYPAQVVRNATWLAEGSDKQATIIVGERVSDTRNRNFFTSNADGTVGYNIEGESTRGTDGQAGTLCVRARYSDIHLNVQYQRPSWVNAPPGSENDRYLSAQAARDRVRVIFGAATVVRRSDGRELIGPQLIVTKADVPIAGTITGAVITNDRHGSGDALFAMADLRTNENFDAMVRAQSRVQTASLGLNGN